MDDIIKVWEEKRKRIHKGTVELNPGQDMVYYDPQFVVDMLAYITKLRSELGSITSKMIDVHTDLLKNKELRDERTRASN